MAEARAERLDVDLGDRSYPIFVGAGLVELGDLIQPYLGEQVFVVSNETVAPLYLDQVTHHLGSATVDTCVLPDGERHKTFDSYRRVIDELMQARHNRTTTLVALGGGVVGDITGFAAATYQRGVGFVQIPTTLLAQVDSSVGGKTGVNHPAGKNMIGAFYQPRCVIADTKVLDTLPRREYLAGLAEVIKYGIIRDAGFFDWLEANLDAVLDREPDVLARAIRTSCAIKAEVVAQDEREADVRAILNFGHTFAHALEMLTDYSALLHGEAVGIGMVLAADLSVRMGWLSTDEAQRIRTLITTAGLPVQPPEALSADAMVRAMGMDKKVIDGRLRLVLSRGIGQVEVTSAVDEGQLRATLTSLTSGASGDSGDSGELV